MTNYGLSTYQIKKANDKLEFNKEFMRSNGIQLDDKIVPFADFVNNNYMNSDRYVAELQHRAWSVFDYSKEKNLSNIFITFTLPSKWHEKKTIRGKLVFNNKFGGRKYIKIKTLSKNKYKFYNAKAIYKIPYLDYDLDFSSSVDKYTPRNASKELSTMIKKLFNERSYRSIDNDDRCYFRVTEPHKNGTPHVHMSLFVPASKVDGIVKSVNRLFPAPLSKVETDVDSPVSYLMKYVLKTLDDLRDDNDKITNLTLWYLYHGISRFYTSRTFTPLDVYRKLNGMYTLIELTKSFHNEDINIYTDTTTKKVVLIENEFGTLYTPKPINWYDKLVDTDHTYLEGEFEPIYKAEKVKKAFEIIIDDVVYTVHNHILSNFIKDNKKIIAQGKTPKSLNEIIVKKTKTISDMMDYELFIYFEKLDIETCDMQHYGYVKNLLITKGLLDGEIQSLTSYKEVMEF